MTLIGKSVVFWNRYVEVLVSMPGLNTLFLKNSTSSLMIFWIFMLNIYSFIKVFLLKSSIIMNKALRTDFYINTKYQEAQ